MDDRARQIEQRFEAPMLLVAVLVIPAVVVEFALPESPWPQIALILNVFCWAAFAAEWVTMMAAVTDRRAWLTSHWLETLVVFLAVPVLLPSAGAIRLLRLSRLLRLAWVAKRARSVLSVEGLPYVALVAGLSVIGAGAAFSLVERTHTHPISAWEGMWWAASTVTTVGYGDESPHTVIGKVLAIGVMLIGIGFVALLTGAIAQHFASDRGDQSADAHDELLRHLRDISARLEAVERAVHTNESPSLEYAETD